MRYKKADFSGFSIIAAIVLAIIVILFLALFLYPKIQETGLLGIKIAEGPTVAEGSLDLILKTDDENFNCAEDYVNIFNVGAIRLEDVEIRINGAPVILDLPGGAVIPVPINGGAGVTVQIDPLNNVAEVSENNNGPFTKCP